VLLPCQARGHASCCLNGLRRDLGLASSFHHHCAWRIDRSEAFRGFRQARGEFTIVHQGHSNELGWRSFCWGRSGGTYSTPVYSGKYARHPRRYAASSCTICRRLTPRTRRVSSRTRALNRSKVFAARRHFGRWPCVKLKPQKRPLPCRRYRAFRRVDCEFQPRRDDERQASPSRDVPLGRWERTHYVE
jgi:hypothetical protein